MAGVKEVILHIWHHWYQACELTSEGSNKRERKRKNLLRLGVNKSDAYSWSRTRMGGWAVAQSPIMGTTITIERLKKRGYETSMLRTLNIPDNL